MSLDRSARRGTPAGAHRLARRVLAGVALCFALLSWPATPALAGGDAVDVQVQCVWDNGDGSVTAVWSYTNHTSSAIDIPVGPDNRVTTAPADRGQPTHFLPGVQLNAWVVTFTDSSLAWHLLTSGDTANNGSPKCPTNPVPEVGDWRATVVWVVVLAPAAWLFIGRSRLRGRMREVMALPSRRAERRR